MSIGVAISTTGDEHRMPFLETCVSAWDEALPVGASLFVTVDGSEEAHNRVHRAVMQITGSVFRVGQPRWSVSPFSGRMGVAVNKNTGLELLMDTRRVEHLFLCDDDTWPLYPQSLDKHMDYEHSMVMWGQSRLDYTRSGYAAWNWPRGVLLYQSREVVNRVGGMDEAFGPGGHEHVEYSQRIHNAGMTDAPFISPASYATRKATGASALWHAEDMRGPQESVAAFLQRKKRLTSIHRAAGDWEKINAVMASRKGSTDYVPFRAHENGRASATLCENLPYQEDCAVEPATPRSEK